MKSSIVVNIVAGLLLLGCQSSGEDSTLPTAQAVVDSAISKGNLHLLANAKITFGFRDRTYGYKRSLDQFEYTRLFIDSTGVQTLDILTNDGLVRQVSREEQQLSEKKRDAYSNSVNSVIYFAFLPHRLNDVAVTKTHLGTVKFRDKLYHKIMVTFIEDGGGEDFQDVFIYWFDTVDYSMDFLAYEYQTNGGGIRFREATNPRDINGVRIQDYINYKPRTREIFELTEIDQQFQQGKLEKLSTIDLKNVKINIQLNE